VGWVQNVELRQAMRGASRGAAGNKPNAVTGALVCFSVAWRVTPCPVCPLAAQHARYAARMF